MAKKLKKKQKKPLFKIKIKENEEEKVTTLKRTKIRVIGIMKCSISDITIE